MSATVRRDQSGIFFGGDSGGMAPAGARGGGGGGMPPPEITVGAPTDGGSADSPVTVVTGLAVDEDDKHKLIPTTKSVTIPSFPPSGWSEQTRVTQIRYDSTYHKLQVKTGTVLVKDSSESDWTDVITFEEFDA